MILRLNRIHFPVTTLGPGRRVGIWLQGCTLACPGCMSRDTWAPDGGAGCPVEDVVAQVRAVVAPPLSGVTITGGEPFQQAPALAALLAGLRSWSDEEGLELDLLCYSGYELAHLEAAHADVLALLDVVVPGPYRQQAGPGGRWRGSANQSLVALTPLGEQRYDPAAVDTVPVTDDASLQISVVNGQLFMIGIPRPRDLARLQRALDARGVSLQNASWRP